jgi:hypothetical protein
MRTIALRVAAVVCVVGIGGFHRVGFAQVPTEEIVDRGSAIDMPLDQAVAEADAVVVATVTSMTARFVPMDPPVDPRGFKKLVTEYTIVVRDVLKERQGGPSRPATVWMRGGRVVGDQPMPEREPLLQVGGTYVLMLLWNEHASMYELNNAGESTWELAEHRVRAVGKGRHVKAHARERPEQLTGAIKRIVAEGGHRRNDRPR